MQMKEKCKLNLIEIDFPKKKNFSLFMKIHVLWNGNFWYPQQRGSMKNEIIDEREG